MFMYSKHTHEKGTLSTGDKVPVAASSCAASHCMLASALTNGMGRRSDDALVPAASETSRLRSGARGEARWSSERSAALGMQVPSGPLQ